jgi:RNA polymerase sigma-70 factor (sigma-E family)
MPHNRPSRSHRGVGADTTEDFTEFVHANGARLHRTAVLLTGGDSHLAEDLLQTTYARLFASWRRVSRAGNPVGYARTTLTNVFLSHRRVRRNAEIPTEELPEEVSYDLGPEGRLDLMAALGRLPPTDRAVVVLRYWEDRSVAETAAELGLSELAVRSRASRALVRLRPHITPATKETR